MTEPDAGNDDSENGPIRSISAQDPTETISVSNPAAELHDSTERFEQTRPGEVSAGVTESAVKTAFWRLVLALDLGLAALPLGAMFIWFRGNWGLGGPLAVVGIVTLGYAGYRYTALRRRIDAGEFDAGVDEDSV